MKTKLLFLVLLININVIFCQTTYVPDNNFEQALITIGIDTDNTINQSVATADISGVTSLNLFNKDISDLTGIQDFISLTYLNCNLNQLTSLDISQNTNLTYLSCFNNQLTNIDVSNNTALTYLSLTGNQLTSIDVTQNTLLTVFGPSGNQLTSIDISQNTALELFQCSGNQISSLDVSNNTALVELYCSINQLSNLDVSNNTLLTDLACQYNPLLTTLDLSNNLALEGLNCSSNPLLSTLDITNNTNLIELSCNNNPLLTTLDLSNNIALEKFYGPETPFTSLDFSNNTALTELNCSYNLLLTSLNVKNGFNSSITSFDARTTYLLECIQVDDETAANEGEAPYTNWIKDTATFYSEDCASLSLEDESLAQSLSFYPNPVHDFLTIESNIPLTKVEIYSILGNKVKDINSNFNSIPMDALSTGIYIVRIQSKNGYVIKKLIKE